MLSQHLDSRGSKQANVESNLSYLQVWKRHFTGPTGATLHGCYGGHALREWKWINPTLGSDAWVLTVSGIKNDSIQMYWTGILEFEMCSHPHHFRSIWSNHYWAYSWYYIFVSIYHICVHIFMVCTNTIVIYSKSLELHFCYDSTLFRSQVSWRQSFVPLIGRLSKNIATLMPF